MKGGDSVDHHLGFVAQLSMPLEVRKWHSPLLLTVAGNLVTRERANMWHSGHHFFFLGLWLTSPSYHKMTRPHKPQCCTPGSYNQTQRRWLGQVVSLELKSSKLTLPYPLCDAGAATLPTRGS